MTKVLVTGATGFIGQSVSSVLLAQNHTVIRTARRGSGDVIALPLDTTEWTPVLEGIDVVVHCAALAHVEASNDPAFVRLVRELNIYAPLRLAKQAKEKRVKRFIFLSSVKSLGEGTEPRCSFNHESEYSPEDLYGESKRDAEIALKQALAGSGTDLVIIRSPLVYGPGVKGNFRTLMGIAKRNIPLPFKSVTNKRSLVSLSNLVDLIVTCVEYQGSLNDTFLVSDDHDLSTKELLDTLIYAYGKKPRLIPFPVSVMRNIARLIGRKSIADRLLGNLQVDISHTKRTLNWKPKVSFQQAIQECVEAELDTLSEDNAWK